MKACPMAHSNNKPLGINKTSVALIKITKKHSPFKIGNDDSTN